MGLSVVYRYRPMRLVPTITTRLVITRLSSTALQRTLCLWGRSVNRQRGWKCTNLGHFLALGRSQRTYLEKWVAISGSKWPSPPKNGGGAFDLQATKSV